MEPEQFMAPGLRPRIWTLLSKGVEYMKKQKNEVLETDMDFLLLLVLI